MVESIEAAVDIARAGYADVHHYLGATGFQIVDGSGKVIAKEARQTRIGACHFIGR